MGAEISPEQRRSVPVEEGLFKMPDEKGDGYLVGQRCKNCGSVWWPKRFACAKCCHRDLEEIPLQKRGKLFSYAILRQAPRNTVMKAPYAVGLIELPEGCRFWAAMDCADLEKIHIGQEVEVVFKKIKEDGQGNEVISFLFRCI